MRLSPRFVVKVSSPSCPRCPAVTAAVIGLEKAFEFARIELDVTKMEDDLIESLAITKLPTILIYDGEENQIFRADGATVEVLQLAVRETCGPRLVLDSEF